MLNSKHTDMTRPCATGVTWRPVTKNFISGRAVVHAGNSYKVINMHTNYQITLYGINI